MMNIKYLFFNVLIFIFVNVLHQMFTFQNDSTLPYWTILGYFFIILNPNIYTYT